MSFSKVTGYKINMSFTMIPVSGMITKVQIENGELSLNASIFFLRFRSLLAIIFARTAHLVE